MSKEITKAFILQEIEDKFKLRELSPEKFTFVEEVRPVYDIGQHLEKWTSRREELSIIATGPRTVFTVPLNERWKLWRYDVVFMGGAYTVAGLYTSRYGVAATYFCYLDLGAAKSVSYHIDLPIPVVLNAGDKVYVNVDGYTSTGDLRIYCDYMVEEIR